MHRSPRGRNSVDATQHDSTLKSFSIIGFLLANLILLAGCYAQTDREIYAPGDSGTATFTNSAMLPAWLGGCTPFVQQRWDGKDWISEGGEFQCFWEGVATPVPRQSSREDSLTARTPGEWRLAYDVGLACRPDEPLGEKTCRRLSVIHTKPFVVAELDDDEAFCVATGGSWDLGSCGDYQCGQPPICAAVIPGCDCGPDANFIRGDGCVENPICTDGGDEQLCVATGGVWDPLSCGHYSCGNLPECTAVIPGCNCGPSAVFDEVAGCLAAPCGVPIE